MNNLFNMIMIGLALAVLGANVAKAECPRKVGDVYSLREVGSIEKCMTSFAKEYKQDREAYRQSCEVLSHDLRCKVILKEGTIKGVLQLARAAS